MVCLAGKQIQSERAWMMMSSELKVAKVTQLLGTSKRFKAHFPGRKPHKAKQFSWNDQAGFLIPPDDVPLVNGKVPSDFTEIREVVHESEWF